jgi:DNA invertase Pin-like site-specific DNA recombinase/transcription elongation factor Elf1
MVPIAVATIVPCNVEEYSTSLMEVKHLINLYRMGIIHDMKKVNAIYLRKSSIANEEEMVKFERQQEELIETVSKLPEEYEVFNDVEASSRNNLREEYVRLKDWVKEGKVKAIYVIDESRLSRDAHETLGFYDLLQQKKVKLITLLRGEVNLTDESSELMAGIKSLFNQYEYKNTVRKIEEGKMRSIKAGVFNGKIPFGYSRGKDKRLVPNDDARTVVKMFNLYKKGWTTRQIANQLNDELNTDKWSSTQVSRILNRETYLGRISYRSEFLDEETRNDNAHEPLIDLDTFRKVQEMLKHRKKTTYEQHRENTIGVTQNPLHRLVYCRNCGHRRSTSTSNTRSGIYYSRCKNCGDSGINVNVLYNFLLQRTDDMILELKELLHGLQDDEAITDKNDDRLKEVTEKLQELKEERQGVIRLTIKKRISEEESDSLLDELDKEIENLQQEEKELLEVTEGKTTEDKVFEIEDIITNLELILSGKIQPDEVNRILRGVIEGVYFMRETEYKIPSIFVVWSI